MAFTKHSIVSSLALTVLFVACSGGEGTSPANSAPTADAGAVQHVTIPVTVTLDGSASSDPENDALTYSWTLPTVPAGSAATLSGSTSVHPTFTPDLAGSYVAQLVVSDGRLSSTAATVTVGVSDHVELLTNGSFESGLTGWTSATNLQGGATGTGSYNGVTAPGTETLTSVAGFPATDGTQLALGSVSQTTGANAIISSVLYQDVLIPAEATTAVFSFDIGLKDTANGNNTCNAAMVGIFSAATVPGYGDTPVVGGGSGRILYAQPADTALNGRTSASIDVSSRAGTTVRFAIINAANYSGHEVIGIDNVKFTVLVSY